MSLRADFMAQKRLDEEEKEIKTINQLKAENEELEKELRQKKMTILMNNDHYFEVDQENKKLKQTLTEIKEIAQYDVYTSRTDLCLKLNWIKKKINEVEDENM